MDVVRGTTTLPRQNRLSNSGTAYYVHLIRSCLLQENAFYIFSCAPSHDACAGLPKNARERKLPSWTIGEAVGCHDQSSQIAGFARRMRAVRHDLQDGLR